MMSYGVIQMHILWWVFVFIAGSHVVSCERKKSNILYLPFEMRSLFHKYYSISFFNVSSFFNQRDLCGL